MLEEILRRELTGITDAQVEKFRRYFALLVEWNEKMNLTAITDEDEVATKHFLDSLLPLELIPKGARIADVGTGAGFPGVPILIMREDVSLTLVDSLQKRLTFLEALTDELGLSARTVHARAEDAGQDAGLRGKFDIVTSRALSSAPVALEWTVPLLKVGGASLMYKGAKAADELAISKNAAKLLKCTLTSVSYEAAWGERSIIVAKKLDKTPSKYPRKAGTAQKSPL